MSGQLTVGVIGQTLRSGYCRAYFTDLGSVPALILTDDPGAFSGWEPPTGVEISPIDDDTVARHLKLRRRFRRIAIEWMRGGSAIGALAETVIRRLRPPVREGTTDLVGADVPLRYGLLEQLEALHQSAGIAEIVVFDVFDLPSILAFADARRVPVIVR